MNKNTTFFILILSVMLAMLVYGCSHSGGSVFVNNNEDYVITSKEAKFNEQGRIPTMVFSSGIKIEASEEKTLNSGVVVSVIEKKITSNKSSSYFDNYFITDAFYYEISAFKQPSNSLEKKTYVTTLEKPFKITIPKSIISQGVTFVGIKESETAPWRYFSFSDSDEALANIASFRASESSPTECVFNLFRLGVQFALITFEGNSGNKLPETFVSSLIASSTASIHVKDGKYTEDIPIKAIMKGVNLDSIKHTDLKARITFRSDNEDEAPIKVNCVKVKQTCNEDKTVPGYSFSHSFDVEKVDNPSLMGTNGEFEFTLNLEEVETKSFPSGFLIEFYNKIDGANILPYIYAEFYKINQIEVVSLSLKSEEDNIVDEEDNLFCLNPTFTVTSNYKFSDTDKKRIASAISVSNYDSEKIIKTWKDNTLTISFDEPLQPNTDYSISISEVSDLESAEIKPFDAFNFTTVYNKCTYLVVHQQQNIVDNEYTVFEEEKKTARENAEVTPDAKIYKGFESPEVQTITVASGSENRIVYSYNRKVSDVIIHKDIGIETVSGEGSYRYGATVVASCTMKKDFTFDKWTDSEGNEIAETFTMPDTDIEITANTQIDGCAVIINKGRGIAEVSGEGIHAEGSTVIASCTMQEGYVFDKWTDSEGNEVPGTFTMPAVNVIITANAKAVTYEIIYNLAEGNPEGNNPTRYTIETETFSIVNPTKYGYTFAGWTGTNLDSASTTLSIVQGSLGNKEFTANFTPISYSITCNPNGGSFAVENPSCYDITSATINLINPTQEGYTFTGWTGTDLDSASTTLSIVQGSSGNREYTANWSINSYYLSINKTSGINTVTGDGLHEYNSEVTASCTLLNGYEFDSWTGDFTAETFTMPASNATMTANAKPISYSISCDSNGGSFATENPESYDITSATITLNNPTKADYDFLGWEGTSIPEGTASMTVTIPQGSIGNKSYVASFSLKYNISYNLVNGTVAEANPETYNFFTPTITLNNPTKDSYDFLGWTGTDILPGTASMTVTIPQGSEGPRSYTASFTPKFEITYDLEGGSLETDNPLSYNEYTETFTLNNPTKEGYDFLGWVGTDIPEGMTFYEVNILKGSTGTRNYTASYTQKFTITYNLNNGSIIKPNPNSYNVYTDDFTLHNPVRPNYAFAGWTEGTATFTKRIVKIPQGSTGDKVFTANWHEKLTFTLPGGIPLVVNKCPAGTFMMGSPIGEMGKGSNETLHKVKISKDFYLGKFEVTQEQYQAVMGNNPSSFNSYEDSATRPVEYLKCSAANSFCASLTQYLRNNGSISNNDYFDLPTEAQWEYACRAGTISALNSGEELTSETGVCSNLDKLGWYDKNSNNETHSVGQKLPNNWEFYDMHGNVHEFCKDLRPSNYPDYTVDDPEVEIIDPYITEGTQNVIRSGCFINGQNGNAKRNRSASRQGININSYNNNTGFRVIFVKE